MIDSPIIGLFLVVITGLILWPLYLALTIASYLEEKWPAVKNWFLYRYYNWRFRVRG